LAPGNKTAIKLALLGINQFLASIFVCQQETWIKKGFFLAAQPGDKSTIFFLK